MKIEVNKLKILTEGGEGIIYKYNKDKLIKIYKDNVNKIEKEEKLKILLNKKFNDNVITPIELCYDNNNNFIGYLMNRINDIEELKQLSNKKFIITNGIKRKDIIAMLIKIKNNLIDLHNENIVISDFNDKNILFDKNFNIYFIDVDSYSIDKYKCNVVMDLFKDPVMKLNNFSKLTDYYAYAVLSFKSLTRIHPFGGNYNNLDILNRIKKRLSLIGNFDKIQIPTMAEKYNFLSEKIIKEMKSIFEDNNRFLLSIEDMKNLRFCNKCNDYYHNSYQGCPICKPQKIISKIKNTQNIPYRILLKNDNIKIIFNLESYLGNDGYIYYKNKRKLKYEFGIFYYFDDKNIYQINDNEIKINKNLILNRQYKSCYVIQENIYYIKNNKLIYFNYNKKGNNEKIISNVSNRCIFNIYKENYFICNIYDNKKIIEINKMFYEFDNKNKIINYNISYDKIKNQWLFIFENENNEYKTLIFKENKLLFENDIKYNCYLNNICFDNGIIYYPENNKIIGFNFKTNIQKEFNFEFLNNESKLIKEDKIYVINEKEIYELG
jgi:hypothetical protein